MKHIRFERLEGTYLDGLLERKEAPIDAIPTHLPTWNDLCEEEGGQEGLAKGWNIVVGGVTGTGKSYFCLNVAAEAVRHGHRVGNINFEMSDSAVATRWMSILSGVPKYKLQMGPHFDRDYFLEAKERVDGFSRKGGLLISNGSAVFSLDDIEQAYERLVTEEGIEMMVVDYAQLVMVHGSEGIFQRSEAVATKLRELTHRYGVVTIAVSQFNRDEAKKNQPPTIHGLMGGGIWEHSADQILLLNHTLRQQVMGANGRPSFEYTELLGGKNRHGIAPFVIPMRWDYTNMRFHEYLIGTDHDDPWSGTEIDVGGDGYTPTGGPEGGDKNLVGDGPLTGDLFDD